MKAATLALEMDLYHQLLNYQTRTERRVAKVWQAFRQQNYAAMADQLMRLLNDSGKFGAVVNSLAVAQAQEQEVRT